jgi:hypothetical protein
VAATADGAWSASARGMERHRAHGLKRGVAFLTLLRTSGRGDEEGDRGDDDGMPGGGVHGVRREGVGARGE